MKCLGTALSFAFVSIIAIAAMSVPQSAAEESKDFYTVLGVPQNASTTEIKKAFRALCRLHHPQYGHPDGERIREIIQAYNCLKDDNKRTQYDGSGGSVEAGEGGVPFRGKSEFEAVWHMSMQGTGYKFSTNVNNFSLEEMLTRRGKYEQFLAWFSVFVQRNVFPKHKSAYWVYGETPAYIRWETAKGLPFLGKMVMILSMAAPLLVEPDNFAQSFILAPLALGFFELWTWMTLNPVKRRAVEMGHELESMIKSLIPNPADQASRVKFALLSYDLVEIMANTNHMNLADKKWILHDSQAKIGEQFSMLYHGWLLRSVYQGRPDAVNDALLADVRAHRSKWESALRDLEGMGAGLIKSEVFADIRKTLGLEPQNVVFAAAQSIFARVATKAHLVCEKLLQGY